jgi:LPS sulfotransferase NodH
MRGYAICTEPRSGSVFLCRLLISTGVLGWPTEYFNANTVRTARGIDDYPLDPEAQLAAIPTLGATENGVYGVKIFSEHFDTVKSTRWAERLPSLAFIHLERLDLLGQAISLARATQTQQWVSFRPAQSAPAYDRKLIEEALVHLARAQTRWRYYFARNGLPVLHLVYEQMIQHPRETIEAVARLIGLGEAPKVDMAAIGELAIQRDSTSQEWRARFVAESRDPAAFI